MGFVAGNMVAKGLGCGPGGLIVAILFMATVKLGQDWDSGPLVARDPTGFLRTLLESLGANSRSEARNPVSDYVYHSLVSDYV